MLVLPDVTHDEQGFTAKNMFPVFYWNHAALEMNRVTHSLGGPQTGPTMSARAIGLLHLAMHDAFIATLRLGGGGTGTSSYEPYLAELRIAPPSEPAIQAAVADLGNTLVNANDALTGAAVLMLDRLYRTRGMGISAVAHQTLSSALSTLIANYGPPINVLGPAYRFGELVGNLVFARLAVKPGEPGADQGRFEPMQDRYAFRDEPSNPVRRDPIDRDHPEFGDRPVRTYHAPFYGTTVASFAVTDDALHQLAEPPVWYQAENDLAAYNDSVHEVRRAGGAPGQGTTQRKPDQTVAAVYWAYDGSNLIGTPPRLYNQIVRTIAWQHLGATPDASDLAQNTEFVRIFALCNAAMADAGKFAWREKYRFQLWRPLSGVREHDPKSGPSVDPSEGAAHLADEADPFWLAFGAPETNTNKITFKPPFPAYPSGHATFGAACFQMLRLFYASKAGTLDCTQPISQECDKISFSFVSDELNGISRDLHQAYEGAQPIVDQAGLVRTRIVRHFPTLSHAIYENAFSRIWLGVHWNFDAFAPSDAQEVSSGGEKTLPNYKDACSIEYGNVYKSNRAVDTDYPVGGVPLGIGIANDIFCSGLVDPKVANAAASSAPSGSGPELAVQAALRGEQIAVKASNSSTARAAQ